MVCSECHRIWQLRHAMVTIELSSVASSRRTSAKNPFMYIFVYYMHNYTIIYLKYRVYCYWCGWSWKPCFSHRF